MNRGIWIALALLMAAPTHGQEPAKKGSNASAVSKKKPAKPGKKGAKPAQESSGSAAWGTGGPAAPSVASKKPAPGAPKHAAERAAMLRQRSILRYSVESCQDNKNCDTALREDASHRFMDSCLPCATREECEKDRDAILAGTAKSSSELCSD